MRPRRLLETMYPALTRPVMSFTLLGSKEGPSSDVSLSLVYHVSSPVCPLNATGSMGRPK